MARRAGRARARRNRVRAHHHNLNNARARRRRNAQARARRRRNVHTGVRQRHHAGTGVSFTFGTSGSSGSSQGQSRETTVVTAALVFGLAALIVGVIVITLFDSTSSKHSPTLTGVGAALIGIGLLLVVICSIRGCCGNCSRQEEDVEAGATRTDPSQVPDFPLPQISDSGEDEQTGTTSGGGEPSAPPPPLFQSTRFASRPRDQETDPSEPPPSYDAVLRGDF